MASMAASQALTPREPSLTAFRTSPRCPDTSRVATETLGRLLASFGELAACFTTSINRSVDPPACLTESRTPPLTSSSAAVAAQPLAAFTILLYFSRISLEFFVSASGSFTLETIWALMLASSLELSKTSLA
eukprot:Lithocolla_globosa_v1_NODE_805_length_3253_cov_31.566604.p4 type:complete len:132 gc:universal NODE_805_length_3253_cov_31.566604:1628-1233(-)